jgi:SAM-dependent methyltransferase
VSCAAYGTEHSEERNAQGLHEIQAVRRGPRQARAVRYRNAVSEPLRETFDSAAELYDRARPGYPPAMFDDLADLACIGAGCRVLEIGCGTGKATVPLAARGADITCVELGANMAAVARRNLADSANVRIEVGAFEEWQLPVEPFDTVLSATAFHWLDPATRVSKSARALKPGGVLATIDTHHVKGGSEELFIAIQDCYEHWDPATTPDLRLQPAAEIPFNTEDGLTEYFETPVFRRYEWDLVYTTRTYLDTLLTYSGHIALPTEQREGLLACIANLIESRNGGRITKRYLTELRVARRR